MPFVTSDLKPRIGTRIDTDLPTLLSGNHAGQIRDLLEERGVLVFPGIAISDEAQVAFTDTLGDMGVEGVYKVTFDEAANPVPADYNYGNFSWHIDRTDLDLPPRASILSPRKLSPDGTGRTMFANTYAAYADLSDADKALLDELEVVHVVASSFREKVPHPTEEQLARWATHPDKVHPLVWLHRSGRKSLVTSTSATRIVGMAEAEGRALLDRLMAWTTQPDYVYTHDWAMGDLLMWDNTGTMHKVQDYDLTCGRRLHRTTLIGEEPIAPSRRLELA